MRNWVGNETVRDIPEYMGGEVNICTGDDLAKVVNPALTHEVEQATYTCYSDQAEVIKEYRKTGTVP